MECAICFAATMSQPVTLPCGHSYCGPCINRWRDSSTRNTCPICRSDLPRWTDRFSKLKGWFVRHRSRLQLYCGCTFLLLVTLPSLVRVEAVVAAPTILALVAGFFTMVWGLMYFSTIAFEVLETIGTQQ